MKNLWEVDHPYYMTEGCYFDRTCHNEYESFDDFLEEWDGADVDYNWVIRWDWISDLEGNALKSEQLRIQFFAQRKGYPITCFINNIKREDQDKVIAFLKPYAEYMAEMWQPFKLSTKKE
jgi:hypothetical protein